MQRAFTPLKHHLKDETSIDTFNDIIEEADFQLDYNIIKSLVESPGQSKYLLANHTNSSVFDLDKRLLSLQEKECITQNGEGENILYWATEIGKAHNQLNSNINMNVRTFKSLSPWDRFKNYFKSEELKFSGLNDEDIQKLEARKERMNTARRKADSSKKIRD